MSFRNCLLMVVFTGLLAVALPARAVEIWIPPQTLYAERVVGNWAVTTDGDTHFTFGVPENFESFKQAKLVLIAKTPGTLIYDLNLSVSRNRKSHRFRTFTQPDLLGGTCTANRVKEIDVSSIFNAVDPPLKAGVDSVSLHMQAHPDVEVSVVGLRFRFESLRAPVGYATVTDTGVVVTSKSRNIVQANIQKGTDPGNYCIKDLPFTPRSVVVAAQTAFDGGETDVIVSAYVSNGTVSSGGCSGKVLVRTYDVSAGGLADRAFMVWLED